MNVILQDEFSGAGPVQGRTPDTSGSGSWTCSLNNASVFNGSAEVPGSSLDYLDYQVSGSFAVPSQAFEAQLKRSGSGKLDVVAQIQMNDTETGGYSRAGISVSNYAGERVYSYTGTAAGSDSLETVLIPPADGQIFTLRVVLADSHRLYMDGALLAEFAPPSAPPFSSGKVTVKLQGASLGRVVWEGDIPPPDGPFWTRLVGSEET